MKNTEVISADHTTKAKQKRPNNIKKRTRTHRVYS